MIKAVLFDLDGTLVNSLCDLANSVNFALQKFGFPPHEIEKYKYFVGDGMKTLIKRALPEDNGDKNTQSAVFSAFFEHYKHHFADETVVYNGIEELLCALKEEGTKIAVVSNKAQVMCDAVVEKFFGNTFNVICGKREGYPTKPDPALTLHIIEYLGIKPEECLFVGDSGMDMAVAANSGSIGVGVLWGFRAKEELTQNGARYIIESPSQLLKIIGEMNEE